MSVLAPVAVILAAGKGERMRSPLPKAFHRVQGRRMLSYVLETARASGCKRLLVVVRDAHHLILQEFSQFGAEWVEQEQPLGTGDALRRSEEKLQGYRGPLLVLMADAILIRPRTLRGALKTWADRGSSAVVITALLEEPAAYGRVLRDWSGEVVGIVEVADASQQEKRIREVNSGNYVFAAPDIFSVLKKLRPDNRQGEYYLTDAVKALRDEDKQVLAFQSSEAEEALGINTPAELASVERLLQTRTTEQNLRRDDDGI